MNATPSTGFPVLGQERRGMKGKKFDDWPFYLTRSRPSSLWNRPVPTPALSRFWNGRQPVNRTGPAEPQLRSWCACVSANARTSRCIFDSTFFLPKREICSIFVPNPPRAADVRFAQHRASSRLDNQERQSGWPNLGRRLCLLAAACCGVARRVCARSAPSIISVGARRFGGAVGRKRRRKGLKHLVSRPEIRPRVALDGDQLRRGKPPGNGAAGD